MAGHEIESEAVVSKNGESVERFLPTHLSLAFHLCHV